ncbi:hypothetical protein [Vibrio mexicanus]|uniref:hypothetical protein n=1 Tax=Vibrio mexicanus TaxID=1004326 RepID=UPI00063CF62D|nr:hypothetical protein [Vibrio mexicanus]
MEHTSIAARILRSTRLNVSTAIAAGLLSISSVYAAPSEALIEQYNQAAMGDEDQVEFVIEKLKSQMDSQGADALSMVYLGSTQTMMGRDAYMPWNKMKYTEQGLATIAKGLSLISEGSLVNDQEVRQGLPASHLATAIAASTYTSLPDMFNHFERGYDLFLDLLADPEFQQQPFPASSWVYFYAIEAAIRAEDLKQANQWLEVMTRNDDTDPMTTQARAIIADAA